jgi:PAS domain S-box-containing protein
MATAKKVTSKSLDQYVKKGLFYEAVVEDGSDIIFVLDYHANFLYHNNSVKAALGYGPKALVGKNFLEFIHPSQHEDIAKELAAVKRRPYTQGVEFKFRCKDGTYRFLEFNAINLKQKEGIQGLIMDCRDIEQRKKDEAELLRAQKARELFLANISHEIRTPINGISGMATLLSNNASPEDTKTYLSAIKSASENLKVIINDILDLSSIESGKLKFEHIDFSMYDLVISLIGSFKAQALTKNVELNYHIDERAKGVFMGDPVRLNQILINLIGNAMKFTHRGYIKLNISVLKPGKSRSLLQFDVTDTGIGIPKEKMDTIFESFSQADASVTRKYGGTGLGLTIVKQLVEMQKGWIKVVSEEDVGSVFTVAIPYDHGQESAVKTTSQTPLKQTVADFSGFTILLVEDNDINRLYAGSILKSCGCKVEMAENGMVAIGKLKSNAIDIVLMDIQMPVMDGFEATKSIRMGEKETKDVPIIALTANATPKVVERLRVSGFNAYLSKPFAPDELYSTLGKYLKPGLKQLVQGGASLLAREYKIVDLSFLAKVSGNDDVFINDVVSSFLQTTPPLLDGIQEALTVADTKKMAQLIHRVKPSLTMIGLGKTKELADYLEVELAANQLSDYMRQGIEKFMEQVNGALSELGAN